MKRYRYEVYIYMGFKCFLRFETNDFDEACDKAHEIENTSKEDFDGTALYDNLKCEWFGRHERGTAYAISNKETKMETKLYYRVVADDHIVMGRYKTMQEAENIALALADGCRYTQVKILLVKEEVDVLRTLKRQPLYRPLWED